MHSIASCTLLYSLKNHSYFTRGVKVKPNLKVAICGPETRRRPSRDVTFDKHFSFNSCLFLILYSDCTGRQTNRTNFPKFSTTELRTPLDHATAVAKRFRLLDYNRRAIQIQMFGQREKQSRKVIFISLFNNRDCCQSWGNCVPIRTKSCDCSYWDWTTLGKQRF